MEHIRQYTAAEWGKFMGSTAEENMEKWSNLPSPGQHSLMVLIYIYISREISIEHPSVELASLTQLEKWFPLQGERAHSCSFGVFNIKTVRWGDRTTTTDLSIYSRL